MVTQPTLSDVLIEAGFETSIAHRAADVIERDLASVAQQPDVDRRFDEVDRHFDDVDRRFDGVNRRFDRIEVRLDVMQGRFELIDGRLDAIEERFTTQDRLIEVQFAAVDKEIKTLHQRIDDLRAELLGRLAEHKESLERRLSIQLWATLLGFGSVFAVLGYIISRLP